MNKEYFLNEVKELNKEQKEVVEATGENLLTLSPAGTGKTRAVALRTANIILKGENPEKILCVTFTNKACNEMKDRIINTVGKEGQRVYVKTFHGFCFDIVKSEAKKNTDISSDFLVFDEEDCSEIIKEILGHIKMDLFMLSSFIYEVKHHSVAVEPIYRSDIEYVTKDFLSKKGEGFFKKFSKGERIAFTKDALRKRGYGLIRLYNSILKERHGLDFSDLVINTYEILEDRETLNRWREKFNYIQVDEVQDTSLLEYEIIKRLSLNKNLSFFGDINQTIYSWRGSKPFTIIEDFKEEFKNVRVIHFNKNYRSTQVIIKSSNEYLKTIERIYMIEDDLKNKEIVTEGNKIGEKLKYKEFNTLEEEGNFICNIIEKYYKDDLSSVAILTRNNRLNLAYSSILEKRGIPSFLVEEFKFFRRKEIKDALAYLKLALNKYDVNSMKRIVLNYVSRVGDKTIEYIEKKGNKDLGIRLTDFLESSTISLGEPYRMLCDAILSGDVVIFDVESTGVDITKDEIIQIAAIGLNRYGSVTTFEEFIIPSKSVGSSEEVHGFSDEYLKQNGKSPKEVFLKFLSFIKDRVVVGHNVQYDLGILNSELRRLNLEPFKIKGYYDTLDIGRKLYPNLENHKLETLSKVLKSNVKPSHNAMDDILATKDILLSMAKKLNSTSMERMAVMGLYNKRFKDLKEQMDELRELMEMERPYKVLEKIYEISGIIEYYKNKNENNRVENLKELYNFFKNGDNSLESPKDSLIRLLTITSLSNSEIDRSFSKEKKVPIITVHQAKGLEFKRVFLPALNNGVFPSFMSKTREEILEECRLFYVAVTRAKETLYLTRHRHKYERENIKEEGSRFLNYLDKELIESL
ncbi:3'-5' exonuclease [Clostridium hydrogeniformans]|uniref:3'-5' exonuclease n=1 Tax=Clostridium hydrogeniformans TaxID=349933 RepID=UPI000489AFCB|nr:3'-5' exonuclease [Clostridium hydrogeniformans]